ncbi:MAG: type VII secretion-associated protein [Mycobacterium sp.]
MSPRCALIEAGPATIRQLPCEKTTCVDTEMVRAALDGIDDPVVLVDDAPVRVGSLWLHVLRSVECAGAEHLIVVHPSWWAPTRIEVLRAAAQDLADHVALRARPWLLAKALPVGSPVTVEIAERFVVVTGTTVAAESRCGEAQSVADAVVRVIVGMTPAAVLIDVPAGVDGAGALATMIADRLRVTDGINVVEVDDAALRRLAAAAVSGEDEHEPPSVDTTRRRPWALLLLAVLIAAAVWATSFGRHHAPAADRMPTTFLVEGRVAVEVPAGWPTRRVIAGSGSARVQVTSPTDPQVALHVTQSPVMDPTLAGAAESLKYAIDAEPAGVFVDFNPSGSSAGRPAVTYREVRAGHDIRWAVVLDGAVRIGIGCQSRTGDDDAVRAACELAVRSARAIG